MSSDKTLSWRNPSGLMSKVLQNCKREQYLIPSFYAGSVLLQLHIESYTFYVQSVLGVPCPWHIYLKYLSYMKYLIGDNGSLHSALFPPQFCFLGQIEIAIIYSNLHYCIFHKDAEVRPLTLYLVEMAKILLTFKSTCACCSV